MEELHNGFCVRFLADPAALAKKLPEGITPLRASDTPDLHPALRGAVQEQAEFAGWVPSNLCLFYFMSVDAEGQRVREDEVRKAPMFGVWTVAAADSAARRRDVAIEVLTNNGRLERAGNLAGLDFRNARTSIGKVPPDDDGVVSGDDRYQIRIGKTQLVWDGRPAGDSSRVESPVASEWRGEGRQGGWINGKLAVAADWTRPMVGSLKVEGKDDLARMLKASPIRFVGPGYYGGTASLEFGR
jgi:hypothetical protein